MAENHNSDAGGAPTDEGHVVTLDALHLDGKGQTGLEDAEERHLPDTQGTQGDNVTAHANVQSAGRSTFEEMAAKGINQGPALPSGGKVIPDIAIPTEPDNAVDARFLNPFPTGTGREGGADFGAGPTDAQFGRREDGDRRPSDRPTLDPLGDRAPDEATATAQPTTVATTTTTPDEDPIPDPAPKRADPRGLEASGGGIEDLPIKLDIKITGGDRDSGSESVSVVIREVPDGFSFTDGADAPIGTKSGDDWVFTPVEVEDLYLVRPTHYSGDLPLKVEVTVREATGDAITSSVPLDVHVEAVADTPTLAVQDSAGMENSWIPLNIDTRLVDPDGSETIAVYIADLPAGAALDHGTALAAETTLEDGTVLPAGTWVVTTADLADLKVQPPTNDSHDFAVRVFSASVEDMNGDTAVNGPLTIKVDVGLVAPSLSGSGSSNEDTWIDLSLSASINNADGTETLAVYLEDLPAGVELRYADSQTAVPLTDGRYDITGQLDNLQVHWATQHLDNDISFNLRAIARDGDTDTDSATVQAAAPDVNQTLTPVTVIVKAVADTPTLGASAVGVEDKWFDFHISSGLMDQDGSETLTVTISGMPDGAQLSAGTDNGDGSWTLSEAQLNGLQIKGPRDSNADFALTVTATATEAATGDQVAVPTATQTVTVNVALYGDADTPIISVVEPAQHVNEDAFYDIRTMIGGFGKAVDGDLTEINSADSATSDDGSENLVFHVKPIEVGSRLAISADGTITGGEIVPLPSDGYWTVSAADVLAGKVHVGGAPDWSSTSDSNALHFDVRSVTTEDDAVADNHAAALAGTGLTTAGVAMSDWDRLTLVVDPVNDPASVTAANSGDEDQAGGIALTPTVAFTDTDGSEFPTGTVYIRSTDTDMTSGHIELNGVTITPTIDGGATTWAIPASALEAVSGTGNLQWQMQGLKFFPATNLAEDATYDIEVTTADTQSGVTQTLYGTGSIHVEAIADVPNLASHDVAGMENTAIPLNISTSLVDVDGSESLAVYIADLPAGAILSHGTAIPQAVTDAGITIPAGAYRIDPADLSSLTVQLPDNVSNDFTLRVWAGTAETRNGDIALTAARTFKVDLGVVAPSVAGGGGGNEDTWIDLSLSANVNQADGQETLTVYLENLPAGVELRYADSHATVPMTNGHYNITGQLDNLQVHWATQHQDDDITFNLRAVSQDPDVDTSRETALGDPVAPDSAETIVSVTVVVKAVADAPTLSATGVGVEDKYAALDISTALVDADGSESLSAIYVALPAGTMQLSAGSQVASEVVLADGTHLPAGTWVLTPGELSGLRIINLPADSNADFQVQVYSVAHESATGDQLAAADAVRHVSVTVDMFGDADLPTVAVDAAEKIIGEDEFYNLRSALGGGQYAVDGDLAEGGSADRTTSLDGSESLTFRIYPVEGGSRLAISSDANIISGEIQSLPAAGYWTVSAADIFAGKVWVGGAANWAGADASSKLHFDIATVSTENDAVSGNHASALAGTGLDTNGVAVSATQRLTLGVTAVADRVTISASTTGNEDGYVSGTTYNHYITVTPAITLTDTDGSESITAVTIESTDADLFNGRLELNGETLTPTETGGIYAWTIPTSALTTTSTLGKFQISGLKFYPVEHSAGDVSYTVKATTTDTGGATYTTTGSGSITVKAVADAPTLTVSEADGNMVVTGTEDSNTPLGLGAQIVDALAPDPEYLSAASLSGVPSDWRVAYLAGDGSLGDATQGSTSGTWTLDTAKLGQVVLIPPANKHFTGADNIQITFSATSSETATGGQLKLGSATSTLAFKVEVDAVADAPTLQLTHARVDEDNLVKLDIRTALTDTDGSESISAVFLDGAPAGTNFYSDAAGATAIGIRGTLGADGTWTDDANGLDWKFTKAQLASLYLKPAHDSNVDFAMTVTSRSSEGSNGSHADTSATMQVIVRGISDGAAIDSGSGPVAIQPGAILTAQGDEDQLIDPGFGNYTTLDIDGSETLSIVIRDLPSNVGIQMTAGNEGYLKYIGNGDWAIDPAHLGDVRLTTPADYAGTFDVSLDLISTEDDGNSLSRHHTLRVDVEAQADTPSVSVSTGTNEPYGTGTWPTGGIPISIQATPTDTHDGVETITSLSIDVDPTGLPEGTTLTLSLGGTTYTVGASAEITLGGADLAAHFNASTGQLSGLTLLGVPDDWSKDIPIHVTATATDADGSTASRTVDTKIHLYAKADDLDAFTANASVSGSVDTPLDLGLTATLGDTDGTESLYFIVRGLPNGVVLDHGFNAGNGVWIVPDLDGDSLKISSHYTGAATITIDAVVKDTDPDGGSDTRLVDTRTVTLTVTDGGGTGGGGWSDIPTGTVAAPDLDVTPKNGLEDVNFNLDNITATATTGTVSALVISGATHGAVTGGYHDPTTQAWIVQGDNGAGFTFDPTDDYAGDTSVTVRAVVQNGYLSAVSEPVGGVVVANLAPVTDGANVSFSSVASQNEDPASPIGFSVTFAQRDDDHSEAIAGGMVTISGLASGAKLYLDGVELTPDGSGHYSLAVADFHGSASSGLAGLSVLPPLHYSGTLQITASVTLRDGTATSVVSSGTLAIPVAAVPDSPTVVTSPATGNEDTAIALAATIQAPDVIGAGGTYASEYLSVVIEGVPENAIINGASNNNDGTWTVQNAHITLANGQATLTGVSILPPQDYSGTIDLTIKAFTLEASNRVAQTSSTPLAVTVAGVADTPTIDPQNASGVEDGQVALNLHAQLIDLDEGMTLTIAGTPSGASFTDGAGQAVGTDLGGGSWRFSQSEVGTLHFVGPTNASGAFTMTAFATSIDGATTANSNTMSFSVTLTGVADTPNLTVNDASGNEDQTGGIPISLSASLHDVDSETLSLILSGAPAGSLFRFNGADIAASGDGNWYLSNVQPAQLAGLAVRTPVDWNGDFTLSVTAQSSEDGTTATLNQTLDVHVAPVNDAPAPSLDATGQGLAPGQHTDPIRVVPEATGDGSHFHVADVDGTSLARMDVAIASDDLKAGDTLGLTGVDLQLDSSGSLVTPDGIAVSYNTTTHTLSFTGAGSYGTYAKLAESVILSNTDSTMEAGGRTVGITVFDESGASGTVSVEHTIGTGTDGITLTGDARGSVIWNSSDGNTLLSAGSSGNDFLVLRAGDTITTAEGNAGFDHILMQTATGDHGDWTLVVQDENTILATSASGSDKDFVIHLDPGSTVDQAQSDSQTLVFNGDASGRIDFNDPTQNDVAFNNIDRLTG